MTTDIAAETETHRLSRLNKAGLVLATLLGLVDLTVPFQPSPGGSDGPPYPILLLDGLLGVVTIVAMVVAFRTASRGALRLVAGSRVISVITALPAFFVDVPSGLKVLVGIGVLVTVAVVVMVLMPSLDRRAVTD